MNLASGSHVASSSSLRGSNTALLSGKQSGLPQRGTKLSAAAAPHHESVGMATQTVEDKGWFKFGYVPRTITKLSSSIILIVAFLRLIAKTSTGYPQ